jgi:glyoxylase-like metal-dependent hydrolase (beta-lactamase superfamily II)
MNSTRVTDNIIQLTRLHFVNAFLVREDDGFTLVDTTVGGGAEKLIDAALSAGAEIKRIALTHGHNDHVGSLDALKERLGGVEVFLSDLDARIHSGEKVVDGKLPGSWPKHLRTAPDVRLTGGERIGSLEVIPTPGHTPGHLAFLDRRDETLIAGDVYTSYGVLAVSNHFNLRFPLAAPATWDKAKDLESARELRDLGPRLLVVGHGPPVRNPRPAMDGAIARAGGPAAPAGAATGG